VKDSVSSARLSVSLAAVVLLCAIAAGLNAPVLSDEIFSLETSQLGWSALRTALAGDVHPPLYYVLLHLWLAALPGGVEALRVFSGLWAFVAVAWVGALARRRGLDAGVVMLLLACNALVLLMTSYGRMYTLLLAVAVAAAGLAWRHLDGGSWRTEAALAAVVSAGLLTHNWFIFFLFGLVAWGLAECGRRALRLARPIAAGVALFALIWGPAALAQVTARGGQLAWLRRPGLEDLFNTLVAHLWLVALAVPVWLICVGLRRGSVDLPSLAWTGAAMCLVLPWLVSQWRPIYNPRFTIIAAPLLACALAPPLRRAGMPFLLTLAGLGMAWPLWQAAHPPTCTSSAAAAVLRAHARPGDTVLFCRLTRKPVEWYWHDSSVRDRSFPAEIDAHPGYEGRLPADELARQAQATINGVRGRLFIVADDASPASQALIEALGRRTRVNLLAGSEAGKHYFNRLILVSAPESPAAAPRE